MTAELEQVLFRIPQTLLEDVKHPEITTHAGPLRPLTSEDEA